MPQHLLTSSLDLLYGMATDAGPKLENQDYVGFRLGRGKLAVLKGAVFALADGISSSPFSQQASETAVIQFIADYFCTSDAWTVKHAGECVLNAVNNHLYSLGQQTQYRYEKDKGYVCTFSSVILKGNTAHIFHIGDTRIYRIRNHTLEQLTRDHRLWQSENESYLARALGVEKHTEIDYRQLPIEQDDILLLASDGFYECISTQAILQAIELADSDMQIVADTLLEKVKSADCRDNISLQLVKVKQLAQAHAHPMLEQSQDLPFPAALEPGMTFDGFKILSTLAISSRSHVFLAEDLESSEKYVLKTPSVELREDKNYLERFVREEWIARRIRSEYVVKAAELERPRGYLYTITEFIDGVTLAQWLVDNPDRELETVRKLIEQIAKGLLAFHRRDMLHQDIKPENIMIDRSGVAKFIDFGSVSVGGIDESDWDAAQPPVPGTAMYAAPEYFLGELGSVQSDLYSLAVLTYHMLSGDFPYGAQVAKTRTEREQQRLVYQAILREDRQIPSWIDATLRKALHPSPHKRYQELSEFLVDLRQPSQDFLRKSRPPLIERHPVRFWQLVSAVLFAVVVVQAIWLTH